MKKSINFQLSLNRVCLTIYRAVPSHSQHAPKLQIAFTEPSAPVFPAPNRVRVWQFKASNRVFVHS